MKSFAIALALAAIGILVLAFANVPYVGWAILGSALIPLGMSLADHCDPVTGI